MPSGKILYHPVARSDNRESTDAEDLTRPAAGPSPFNRLHIASLYLVLGSLVFFILRWKILEAPCRDPSLQGIWSPAAGAVEYEVVDFEGHFLTRSPFMGIPTDETDRLWESLYDFGISTISADDAAKLHTETLQIPGGQDYLVQLGVFHQLHCLNDLRKALYPERYNNWKWHANGSVDYKTKAWHHWDHCLDSLRQTIMCHGDVTPISLHVNHISHIRAPRLNGTHQCRSFEKIREWGKARQAPVFELKHEGFLEHKPGEEG